MDRHQLMVVAGHFDLLLPGVNPVQNGKEAEHAKFRLSRIERQVTEGKVALVLFTLGEVYGTLRRLGLGKEAESAMLTGTCSAQMPPPPSMATLDAKFKLSLACAGCGGFEVTLASSGWLPAFMVGREGHCLHFPKFDPEQRLATTKSSAFFRIEDTVYDFSDNTVTVMFSDYPLSPTGTSAEQLSFLIGTFREAGWSTHPVDAKYTEAWEEHVKTCQEEWTVVGMLVGKPGEEKKDEEDEEDEDD